MHASEHDLIRQLCRHIEAADDTPPSLAELSRLCGLGPTWLQRRFKAVTGVSPRQYAEACRQRRLRASLREGASVTEAMLDAGYASASRLYEQVEQRLGMTPGQYRRGGDGLAISYAFAPVSLGLMLVAATDRGLCSVQFGDSEDELLTRLAEEFPDATHSPMPPASADLFADWIAALRSQVDGRAPARALPLDIRGTAFQQQVWDYLRRIPAGERRSYTDVAVALGRPRAVRAVASACAANRLALLIPCHRVLRGDGSLGGFKWGLARKQALLASEQAQLSRLTPAGS